MDAVTRANWQSVSSRGSGSKMIVLFIFTTLVFIGLLTYPRVDADAKTLAIVLYALFCLCAYIRYTLHAEQHKRTVERKVTWTDDQKRHIKKE